MLAQPLLDAAALAHEVLAVSQHEPDLPLRARELGHGQVRLAQRHPSHGQRVDRVGLAAPATAAPGAGHQLGRHPQHPLAAPEQMPLQRGRDPAAVLQGEGHLAPKRRAQATSRSWPRLRAGTVSSPSSSAVCASTAQAVCVFCAIDPD